MKFIGVMTAVIAGNLSFAVSQEVKWDKAPKQTAISIVCDAQGIPIYVDGHHVGDSPLKDPIDVSPGWHRVSYFPDVKDESMRAISTDRRIRDIVKMGAQDIYVEEGEIGNVALAYQSIEAEVDHYDRKLKTGNAIGFTVMILFVGLVGWALG
ncbi:MAG: hypothetical protein QF845_00955 [Candidatus Marinimicrobia bacterium]|jgi:hypothetical protein|nr:hypothetical protein [Candidatus Neomarinimicrobiota bacterium]MDP6789081.1 hypothetical protein [Candidatus Neomarinimicrobiota bacterium]MDP7071918.1 hypothetical protein [Candidatus Neomarinimicrobiota bacterium]|tara:strand:- start:388 stop:846 length:459 start_codon:yes stop_codon:yes gene_type:complete